MIADVESGRRQAAAPDAACWLGFAASPTFAVMAFATAAFGGTGPLDILCASGGGAFALSGMTPMYLLMSVFHAAPWLKLAARLSPPGKGGRPPGAA